MPTYPLLKFHFSVEWGGANLAFSEVSGLDFTREMADYSDGLNPSFTSIKIPGRISYSNISLKRGMYNGDNSFYDWWKAIQPNAKQVDRRTLTISLLNDQHEPVVVWEVINAVPVKMTSTDLSASSNDVAIETLELAHEGISQKML